MDWLTPWYKKFLWLVKEFKFLISLTCDTCFTPSFHQFNHIFQNSNKQLQVKHPHRNFSELHQILYYAAQHLKNCIQATRLTRTEKKLPRLHGDLQINLKCIKLRRIVHRRLQMSKQIKGSFSENLDTRRNCAFYNPSIDPACPGFSSRA